MNMLPAQSETENCYILCIKLPIVITFSAPPSAPPPRNISAGQSIHYEDLTTWLQREPCHEYAHAQLHKVGFFLFLLFLQKYNPLG